MFCPLLRVGYLAGNTKVAEDTECQMAECAWWQPVHGNCCVPTALTKILRALQTLALHAQGKT